MTPGLTMLAGESAWIARSESGVHLFLTPLKFWNVARPDGASHPAWYFVPAHGDYFWDLRLIGFVSLAVILVVIGPLLLARHGPSVRLVGNIAAGIGLAYILVLTIYDRWLNNSSWVSGLELILLAGLILFTARRLIYRYQ